MKLFLNNPDFGLMIFRIFIGFTMAFAHGMGKLPPSEQLITGVGLIGFPLPVVFAWSAALSEFLGGIFIGLGLFTRLSAFILGFTMSVAAFVAHAADPFQKKEMALLFLAACVLLLFQGAGKYSVDRIFLKKQ